MAKNLVNIIMGSTSDWEIMKQASDVLKYFDIPHECRVISAHRAPHKLADYVTGAETRGVKVIIAGAGGAAHLPGVSAAYSTLPVIGVPIHTKALGGLDSLLSIVQMPSGIPVGTMAIGDGGAKNAAYLAAEILGLSDAKLRAKLKDFRKNQTQKVLEARLPA